ncbi:MAG: hypothetical protein ACI31R_00985 [Bacilli bacterium]
MFTPIGINTEKTLEGFYKNEEDYQEGEMFNLYYCIKCSRIVSVDFNINDNSPVKEFEKEFKVIKTRKR